MIFSRLNQRILNSIQKLAIIFCFSFITVALIIVNEHPATGYESSIYYSTPSILWFSLFISILIGIAVIISHIYTNQLESYLWKSAFLLLFLSYTISLALYVIRGYYMWCMGGDPSAHMMHVLTIINDGHINPNLFYPIAHIYASSINLILNMNLTYIYKLVPLFFAILSPIFMYNFSKLVLFNKAQIIIATMMSIFLLHSWYLNFTPNHLANLYFPLLLYIVIKSAITYKVEWKILSIIMLFFYPLFHPVPIIALFIIVIALAFPTHYFIVSNEKGSHFQSPFKFSYVLYLFIIVWSVTWISSFGVWETTIKNIYTLIMEESSSNFEGLKNQISYAEGYGYSVTTQIVKVYGGEIFNLALALGSFFIVYAKRFEKRMELIVSLYPPLFILTLFMASLYFFNLMFGPLRILFYIDILGMILVAFLYYYALEKVKKIQKYHLKMLCIFVIILSLTLVNFSGVLKLYSSPYILRPSDYNPETEIKSISWLFEKRNLEVDISALSLPKYKLSLWLLNPEEKDIQKIPRIIPDNLKVPYHFGYNDSSSLLRNSYEDNVYLILNEKDKHIYTDFYPEMASIRWQTSDFRKIENDNSVCKLYGSGGADIYYITV